MKAKFQNSKRLDYIVVQELLGLISFRQNQIVLKLILVKCVVSISPVLNSVRPIRNLSGHSIERHRIHAGKSVPIVGEKSGHYPDQLMEVTFIFQSSQLET